LVWGILGIFALMFIGLTIAALWFAYSSSKVLSRKELQKKKMDIIDKHFNEMVRIECPYCRTIYMPKEPDARIVEPVPKRYFSQKYQNRL